MTSRTAGEPGQTASAVPWRAGRGCVIVRVRVTPKSSKDAVDGIEQTADGPAFRVRVRAVPAEGEANAAVEKLVAAWLEVPKSRVAVIQGGKSRVKSLEITGEVDEITARLAARLAALV
jgi:uncharacterized protein YggU (UPF0235/DUF167 family)